MQFTTYFSLTEVVVFRSKDAKYIRNGTPAHNHILQTHTYYIHSFTYSSIHSFIPSENLGGVPSSFMPRSLSPAMAKETLSHVLRKVVYTYRLSSQGTHGLRAALGQEFDTQPLKGATYDCSL